MRTVKWAVVAATVMAAGCGGGASTCVAGSTVECACPGGTKGAQTCQADGTFGTCACGSTPTNSAPSAPVVAVAPISPTDAQDLVCTISQASSDVDGDAVTYQFAWTKNGQPFAAAVANATSSTVSADATAAGDVFACAASASDGKATGPSSTPVSVTVVSANRAPTAPVVGLSPQAPTDTQDLVCSVTTPATDPDGDALTYQFAWTRNGQPFAGASATGVLASTVPASATTAGDTFACAATANDGSIAGPASAPVSVVVQASNRAPTAPVVTLTPTAPTDAQDLVCNVTTPATDPDGDALTYQFAWTRNGQPFAGGVGTGLLASTVSAAATSAGDTFACAATANDGKTTGPASATVSAVVQASTWASCKALLTAAPGTPDGLYDIDPDGFAGPIDQVKVFCDMTNGGWTLVANIYDSVGDDAPNDTAYVVSGWQQTASGQWASAASRVEKNASGTGSSAVSLEFVAALKAGAGQQNLKMCFVHQDGTDTTCRSSADGSMTLIAHSTGNPQLAAYSSSNLAYTFGRLAGLAGSTSTYNPALFVNNAYGIPRTPGQVNEFGTTLLIAPYNDPTWGLTEHPTGAPEGVWVGRGSGMAYRPYKTDSDELGSDSGPNPNLNTYGFRLVTHQRRRDDGARPKLKPASLSGGGTWRDGRWAASRRRVGVWRRREQQASAPGTGRGRTASTGAR